MDQIRRDPPPPRSLCRAVPRDLETIVLKAMDRDPARRYAGAAELADDLQRFLDRRPTRARRLSASGRLVRWARRSPAVAGLLACVAVTLLTATGVSTYFAAQARLDARAARAAEAAARKAQDRAVSSEDGARRQSALLLLDRGVALAAQGQVAEGLHWMLAALEATDDPGLQRLARTHLAGWSGRAATLRCWIDTPHQAVALSPDGRRLVTAGAPRPGDRVALQFWDPQEGSPVGGPLPTKDFGVESLSFSPDGRTVLAASGAGQINQYKPGWASRWDAQGRRFLGRSPGVLDLLLGRTHRSTVEGAAWSPDGRRFVTCAWDHTLRVWDAAGGRAVGRPIALGGYGYVAPPAFSPDGETVVLVKDKGVRLVEIAAGRSRDLPVTTPTPYCKSAAFSPDGTTLLLGDGRAGFPTSATALPWDPARRAPAGPPRHTASPSAHLSFLRDGRVVSVAGRQVSADGALFVRGRDGFQVWQSPRARSRPAGDLTSLVGSSPSPAAPLTVLWSADARRCWTAGAGQAAQAWETATGLPVGIPLPDAPLRGYSRLALTPDARLAATEPHGGGRPHPPTVVWDVASGLPACRPLPQKNMLAAMDFSPDGRTLATGGHYHTVDLWDVAAGVPLPHSPLRAGDMIMHLAFSPGGTTVAAATWGREVRLWDARSGKLLATLPHRDVPQRVVFNAAGTRLLTLCPSDAHLWDLASGARVGSPMAFPTVPEGRGLDLRGLFSPDGRVILLAGGFGSFRLHDAATTRPLTRPTPAGKPQRSCFAFSPDGRLVVAGHEDGSAQVWEAASGLPLGAPWVGASPVWGVAFAADGRSVVTVAGPGSFRSWRVPGPLGGGAGRLARALRLATGLRRDAAGAVVPLTRAEWEQERRRWRQTEGDRPWALAAPVSDADWHEARACDAEESGAGFAARWRLDRLIAARPGDWRLYARRARTYTDEGRPELAAADYRRAEARGAGAALTGWYRWRARACASQRRWESVLWYLDRLLARHPDEPGLRQQRADAVARLRLPRKP
jgi:WD40 repeat protein